MFEEFYKSELARRLLLQRFSSIDLEKAAIARLKTVCNPCLFCVARALMKTRRSAAQRSLQNWRRCFRTVT
jgi:hypothetical protein